MRSRRVLILTAGMGAGHNGIAAELARRLTLDGADPIVVDALGLLPLRLGGALCRGYRAIIRHAPWLYGLLYPIFFASRRGPTRASPLTALVAPRLRELVRRSEPAVVVSTYHMAAQAAGRLRLRGELAVPSVVVVTDYAVNRLWLHPGNDRYICEHETAAREVTRLIGRPARRHAPLIRPEFRAACRATPGRPPWDSWDGPPRPGPRDRAVLVVAGSWGTGRIEETARVLDRSGRYLPVVLCGRNTRLRRRLRAAGVGVALGWRDDLPRLLAAAYAVVDNAGGLMCSEAFAAGVPVVSYRPIPGHGRDSVRALARAGLVLYARGPGELLAALDRLGGAEHDRLVSRAAALFTGPRAETLLDPATW